MFKIVFEGTKELIEEKINNPFWKTFIFGWITWNWKIWYITFFISEEKIACNKIEYIKNMYTYFDFYGLFPFLGFLFNWIIIPLFITYLIIFIITEKITFKFLEKHKENKIKENTILKDSIKKEIEITEIKKELVEKETELEELEKSEFPKRDKEYLIFEEKYNGKIELLKDFIYEGGGLINYIESSDLSIFDLLGLIERIEGRSSYRITKKGKYFLKKYTLEN